MSKKIILSFICSLIWANLYSQRTLLAGLQTDIGVPVNTFTADKKILQSHFLSYNFQGAFSLQYKMWNRIGLEIGASQSILKWRMKDKDFETRHPGFVVDLRNKSYYYNYFGNIQFIQKLSQRTNLYLQAGYSMSLIGNKSLSASKVFVVDNEIVTATSIYQPQNSSVNTEVGFQFPGRHHMFSIGIKLNIGKSNLLSGSYQVESESNVMKEDNYLSKGSFIGLTAKYSLVLFHKDKKIKTPKPNPVFVQTPPPAKPDSKPPPKQIAGRAIQVTHRIAVQQKKITIRVWDHQKVDGDRIALNLNGKWILENYTLTKKPHVFQIELNEGKNIFVLHALNLGEIHPNTAAILIVDGIKENSIVLESTLETSGTIEVTYTP